MPNALLSEDKLLREILIICFYLSAINDVRIFQLPWKLFYPHFVIGDDTYFNQVMHIVTKVKIRMKK